MPWLYNFFLKTVCIHILYIYTLKKKNLILLALMVEGEKKSSSFIKKKKKLSRKKLTYDYIILLGLKWDVHIRLVFWTDRPWCEAVHTVAFVGCKTWQILSDEALGDTLHCPFFGGFCCKYLSLTIAHSNRQWLSLDGPGVTLLTKDWTSLSLWC